MLEIKTGGSHNNHYFIWLNSSSPLPLQNKLDILFYATGRIVKVQLWKYQGLISPAQLRKLLGSRKAILTPMTELRPSGPRHSLQTAHMTISDQSRRFLWQSVVLEGRHLNVLQYIIHWSFCSMSLLRLRQVIDRESGLSQTAHSPSKHKDKHGFIISQCKHTEL